MVSYRAYGISQRQTLRTSCCSDIILKISLASFWICQLWSYCVAEEVTCGGRDGSYVTVLVFLVSLHLAQRKEMISVKCGAWLSKWREAQFVLIVPLSLLQGIITADSKLGHKTNARVSRNDMILAVVSDCSLAGVWGINVMGGGLHC